MSGDWAKDDMPADDPFNASTSDVFGKFVDEVDVWGDDAGNNSFDAEYDQDWFEEDDVNDQAQPQQEDDSSGSPSKSGDGKKSQSSHRPKRRGRRPKPGTTRSSSSSSRPRREHNSSSRSSSKTRPSTRESTQGGHRRHRNGSSRSRRPEAEHQKESEHENEVDHFANNGGDAFSATFGTANTDGFAEFDPKIGSPNGSFSETFGDFSKDRLPSPLKSAKRTSRPRIPMSPSKQKHRSNGIRRENSSRSLEGQTPRRGATGMSLRSNNHPSSRRSDLIRRRDGTVTRQVPRNHNARMAKSDERRGSVRDSLVGALGGDEDKEDISLSRFFGREGSPNNSGSGENSSNEGASTHSAPAAIKSSGLPPTTPRGAAATNGKSRRWKNRMLVSPARRDAATKNEPIKVDIAELAKAGHLEMQDGKLRLVIDVEEQ